MTERKITARKPARRRDVSGFGVVTRPKPDRPEPAADSGFADWLSADDSVEVTIDLRSAATGTGAVGTGERIVDLEIVVADDEPRL